MLSLSLLSHSSAIQLVPLLGHPIHLLPSTDPLPTAPPQDRNKMKQDTQTLLHAGPRGVGCLKKPPHGSHKTTTWVSPGLILPPLPSPSLSQIPSGPAAALSPPRFRWPQVITCPVVWQAAKARQVDWTCWKGPRQSLGATTPTDGL